jgi:predicted metal-dependent hydrolase
MKVKDLNKFLNKIQSSKNRISDNALEELKHFIYNSGCKSIRFDDMSMKALGISKTDECVLSYKVLEIYPEYMFYIILHELAHQYQYKKYGKNLTLDIYNDKLEIEYAVEKLLWLEKIADRLAIKKMKYIFNICKKEPIDIKPRYLNLTDTEYLKTYILKIREDVKNFELKTIEDINNYIHKTIKNE